MWIYVIKATVQLWGPNKHGNEFSGSVEGGAFL
jgi:hypothetical protein